MLGKVSIQLHPQRRLLASVIAVGAAAYFGNSSRRQESIGVSVEMWQLHAKVTPYQLRCALVGDAALMTLTVLAAFGFYLDQRHDCGRFVCLFGRRFSINEFPTHGLHTHKVVYFAGVYVFAVPVFCFRRCTPLHHAAGHSCNARHSRKNLAWGSWGRLAALANSRSSIPAGRAPCGVRAAARRRCLGGDACWVLLLPLRQRHFSFLLGDDATTVWRRDTPLRKKRSVEGASCLRCARGTTQWEGAKKAR
ncbi:uncharacterized protein Tco025E_04099, partial [Trypanosoma conorhini]